MNGEWTFGVATEYQRFACAAMSGTSDDGPEFARILQRRIGNAPDVVADKFLRATLLELALRWGSDQHRRLAHRCRTRPCALAVLTDAVAFWPAAAETASVQRPVDLFVAHVAAIRDELHARHDVSLAERAAGMIAASGGTVTLQSTARALGAHPSTLRRAFHREFGMTAREFLARTRVDRAEALLRQEQDAKIEPIALAVGWASKTGLYRAFRQLRGKTPGRVRPV